MSILLTSSVPSPAETKYQRPHEWIDREKIRMGWSPANLEQYNKMAEAGMNAVMPRFELDVTDRYNPETYREPLSPRDEDILAQILNGASLAKKLGLRYFHCLGLACEAQTVSGGFLNNPARFNDGPLPSPLDQVYWQRVILDRVDRVLRLLQDRGQYALDAIIIDPEMYALNDALPGEPDYGKFAFELFLSEFGKMNPKSKFENWEARKGWLEEQGLHAQYVQWQFDVIKEQGRQLRALVDRYDPDLIVGYIIYENRMWFNAISAGLATKEMPVFVGVESTYSGVMDQAMIDLFAAMRESIAVPCFLTPGVDLGLIKNQVPIQRLKALEGNIYQRCQYTAGYWVYAIYNFGDTEEEQSAFFGTLKVVNTALDEQAKTGVVSKELKEGPIPVDVPPGFHELLVRGEEMRPVEKEMAKANLPFVEPGLRGTYTRLLWPEPGKRQSVTYRSIQLNPNYLDRCETQLFDRDGNQIYDGPVSLETTRTIWLPDVVDEFCAQVVSGGMNSFGIPSDEVPSMIATDNMLIVNSRNHVAGRFYFHVPEDRKEFRVKLLGHEGMTADYVLYDAKSQPVKNWKSVTADREETVSVETPGVWCMQIGNLINDGGFRLLDLPNLFGLQPDQVRVSGPAANN